MTESKALQAIVTQDAIKATTVVVMVLREADTGPKSGTNTSMLS